MTSLLISVHVLVLFHVVSLIFYSRIDISLDLGAFGLTSLLISVYVLVLFHVVSMIFYSRIDIPLDLGVWFSRVSRCVYDFFQSD